MHRIGCGLLLAVCASVGSTAALGRVRLSTTTVPHSAAGAASLEGVRTPSNTTGRVWADDHVIVAPRDASELATLAREHGSHVLRDVGVSGYAALAVPAGMDFRAFTSLLRADARVVDAAPDGITRGTGDVAQRVPKPRRARWHMVASNPPADGDARGIVVALLDTGVAYEDRVEAGVAWRRAPSLAGVRFVSPWDFINRDAHPNDDHQHGTHLASLVAAGGAYPGIAPGVSVMPVKVLDQENVGTELALVEGIQHAVKNGADIINMSLSFGRGYVPSKALVTALEAAADAGIVLVAAAGNDGGEYVSQPAANPLVIAVGANRPEGVDSYGAAPYSNASPRVDLMAPGGSVDRDRDEDGLLDGVIGETIALQDPTRTGYWLYAGTSQATALVSGAAARLLAAGHPSSEVRVLLQGSAATETYIRSPWIDGRGRGRLDVAGALAYGESEQRLLSRDLSVALLGWLAPGADGGVRPMARVTVLDERLVPLPGAQVVGMFAGITDVPFTCVTGADGVCVATGPAVSSTSGPAWTISADDVVLGGLSHHPRTALFVGDGFQALVNALDDHDGLDGAVPAWRWRAQEHPTLGPVADALLLGNHGSGIATSPQVFVAAPSALGAATVVESGSLVISGGAPASARLVVRPKAEQRCDAGPTGYEVLHFTGADLTAVVLDATGLADTPLALGAPELMSAVGPRFEPLTAQPVVLSRAGGGCDDPGFAQSPVGLALARGGWAAHGGEPAASALASSADPRLPHVRLAGSARGE